MILILTTILIILFAINDYFIIKSFSEIKFKKYWHYSKFVILCLSLFLIFGFTRNLIVAALIYYCLFEPVLNKLRGKTLFYVSSTGGSKTDEWRTKIFGKYASTFEVGMKIAALIGIILLIIK